MSEAIAKYLEGDRKPWTPGYSKFKNRIIAQTLADRELMLRFGSNNTLPTGYGDRLDERVVEYPWVLSRLDASGLILDAGSTFSSPTLLECPQLKGRRILVYTLATDWITLDPNISYVFGDFEDMLLRDDCVGSISCISTLEHVGLNYDYKTYNINHHWPQQDTSAYRGALQQFHRVLKPGGHLFVTMPFGRYENHGWLQQHDARTLPEVLAAWPGSLVEEAYFRYRPGGWQLSTQKECEGLSYWNIHHTPEYDPDYAAAARAVVCLVLRKNLR
jgi:hypothetical protein